MIKSIFLPKGVIISILLLTGVKSDVCHLCASLGNKSDCSARGLTAVPHCFLNSTAWIDLSHNQIAAIGPQAFSSLADLLYLDLSWNNITSLNDSAFIGLSELTYLNLNENRLSYTSGLTDNVFLPLVKLKELYLFTDDCPQHPPDRYLRGLQWLETLAIVVSQGGGIGGNLGGLQHLDTLLLTSRSCNAQGLNESDLRIISGLPIRRLSLRNLKLDSLNPDFLKALNRTLAKLDLSCNNLDNLPSIIDALSGSNVETLLLDNSVKDLTVVEMNSAFFTALRSTPLRVLSVSRNIYLQIDVERDNWLLYAMPSLRYLRVGYNQFILRSTPDKGVLAAAAAALLFNVRVLDISGLFNMAMYNGPRGNNAFCQELDPLLADTRQVWEDDPLYYPPPHSLLIWLLEAAYRLSAQGELTLPPVMTRIYAADLGGLFYEFLCSTSKVYFENNVHVIDLGRTLINAIDCDDSGFSSVTDISFGQVGLTLFNPAYFSVHSMPRLNTLDFHGNKLGPFIDSRPVNGVFTGMNGVRLLDLSANGITTMHDNSLMGLSNVTFINLSQNSIATWNAAVSSLEHLKMLDISSNAIIYINTKVMADFDAHALLVPGFIVNMSLNPIECTCSSIDFLRWLLSTNVIHDVETCLEDKIAKKIDRQLLSDLQWQCNGFWLFLLVLILLAALLVAGVLSYACRWRIKYTYYKLKRFCRRRPQFWQNEEVGIYVSYHENDFETARKLCDHLENQFGICRVESRHALTIGYYEFELIATLIDECIASVILISPNSLCDSKSEFEFYMALQKGVPYILPIVTTESFAMEDLPRAFQKLLMHNNYLRLPSILNNSCDFHQDRNLEQHWSKFLIIFETCLLTIIERQTFRRRRRSPDTNGEQSGVIRRANRDEQQPLLQGAHS